ncbi:MAG: PH domain-containing protein [Chloroflexota bacterium]
MATFSFRPKMDWWLPTLVFGALGISTVVTLLDPEGDSWAIILVLVLDILGLWVLFGSRYQVGESDLRMTFGPLRFRYPLEEMFLVRKGGWWAQVSSFREPRLRLAFSTDNLIVESRRDGRVRRLVISPRNTQEFLRLLKERAPQVQIEGF